MSDENADLAALAPAAGSFGRVRLDLDPGQCDLIIDALQGVADEVGSQECSDLAVLLRNGVDRVLPGTYGGCDDDA